LFFSLEEYLHEMAGDLGVHGLNHNNQDSLNFSEAALVLQNSSSVYSRKVEYLYSLVLQVHEELITNSGSKSDMDGNNANRKTALDLELEEFTNYDAHMQFLLLDDVLPTDETGGKINLQRQQQDNETAVRDVGASFATSRSNTRLSLGTTLTDRSGVDGRGTAHRFGFATLQDAGRLRLIDGKCDLGQDGILIVPGAGGAAKLQRDTILPSDATGPIPTQSIHDDAIARTGYFGDNQSDGAGDGFSLDDDGGGLALAGDDGSVANHDETRKAAPKASGKAIGNKPKADDPWTLLDPHSQGPPAFKRRPLRIGKSIKLPYGVEELPSHIVTGAWTRPQLLPSVRIEGDAEKSRYNQRSIVLDTLAAKLANQQNGAPMALPEIPLDGLVFGDEFAYIVKANSIRRAKQRKAAIKLSKDIEQEVLEEEDEQGYFFNNDCYGSPALGAEADDGSFVNDGDDDAFGGGMQLADDCDSSAGRDGTGTNCSLRAGLCVQALLDI
jgi:Condensin II complex subunit CAP-H2 or CNDH2, N-terminal/Condensin II complex subunit CAP-H2 or CNDH2, C-term